MPTRYLPAPALRARPDRKGGGGRPRPPVQTGVALRLAIGREGIGLELAQPALLGCVTVTDLAATLPGIRFPVDVSGGVPRFRHRRGELQRLELEIGARALERWAAPRVRGLVGTRSPDVWVTVDGAGATASVVAESDIDEERGVSAAPVLAFDVRALTDGDVLTLVVERARGAGLPLPATALALACVEAVLGQVAERKGAVFRISGAAAAVARALLPEAGARVPSAEAMGWTSVAAAGDAWVLHALHGAVSAPPSPEALRARELAVLLREADDRLVEGDLPAARALCVDAMARAPRHPEIARRIVEIDARAGGRAEAALAMLVEARLEGEARFGTTPGELLLEVGDLEAALASLERTGETEPAPALAGRAFELAASAVRDPDEAARWLDHAVARAPRSTSARWLRVSTRLALGRLEDATADVEHLEAMARGGKAKHRVWVRAGGMWHSAGLATHAGALFERALRYVPDEPRALAGLGVALVGQPGRQARGVAVLARALEVAETRSEPSSGIRLDLARALADRLDDRSTAVAHVSAIPREAAEAPVARGLEGRWRAQLGDLAGAALAYARLRELAGSMGSGSDASRAQVASLLLEGAEVERKQLHDPLAAQRHLATALRLRPHDQELLRAYREVGQLLVGAGAATGPEEGAPPPPAGEFGEQEEASATHRTSVTDRPALDLSLPADVDLEAAARVEELTRLLQADPRNDAVADELASLLETLGRGHELLALMMSRLEDATPERRIELLPRARSALERLAADADRAGRREEAALYRSALDGLT